jgi:CheY-like chemotaxis protein
MAEELRLAGFSVIEADRADDALTYIKAGEQVDLVFSDIRRPA